MMRVLIERDVGEILRNETIEHHVPSDSLFLINTTSFSILALTQIYALDRGRTCQISISQRVSELTGRDWATFAVFPDKSSL